MSAEMQEKTENGWRTADWTWLIWMAAGLLLYLLSSGPVYWSFARGYLRGGTVKEAVRVVYKPVSLAYNHTFLHRPIGRYLHLWAPALVDSNGNTIP